VLTRITAVVVGLLLLARAAPSLAFLTNGLGASHPGSGIGLSAAPTLLLLLPLFSAVLATEAWTAALSLVLLGLLGIAARRAGLRCVRWLDDAADDVERDTPVWRAFLTLGAFFGAQALVAQITAFTLPSASAGLIAGLAYVASSLALLLMTLSHRGALRLRWWPARPGWIAGGALAGAASGGIAWLYLQGIRALGWEPPVGSSLGATEVAAIAVAAIAFAPVAEEAFFRGWLQPALSTELTSRRRLAPLGAALVFALVHPSLSFVPVLVLGVIAGELYLMAGALLPGIVAHAVHNVMALLLSGP
jgi:membrane protease YdiL (CAAX protease family)